MPSWKKVITSGSDAHLNNITASGNISASGDLFVDDITADDVTADKIITDEIDATSNGNLTIDVGENASVNITMDDGSTTPFEFKTAAGGSPTQELGITGNFLLDTSGDITLDAAGDQINFKDNGSTRLTFNLDSTPELDVTGDFIIDGSGGIKLDSATSKIEAIGNITASGNISCSGDLRIDASASIGPGFFNSTYGTDGTLQVKSTTSDSGVPSAIYLEEVSGGEGWRIGVDSDGDLNFYNSTGTAEIVSLQDSNKVHVVGDISSSTDIYAGDDIFAGDDLHVGYKNALGASETSPSINFYSGSNGDEVAQQLIRYQTDSNLFTIGRNHPQFSGHELRLTVHNSDVLSSIVVKSGSNNSLVGINHNTPTTELQVTGDISGSGTGSFGHLIVGGGNFSSASLAAGGGGGGSMDNFTLTADGGSNQTIADGNTLDIAGGTNITTAVGATDTVTINLDASPNVTSISASGAVTASVFRTTTANANGLYEASGRLIISCSDDLMPQIGDDCFFTNAGNNVFTIKGGEQRVGINKTTPGQALEVVGNISASGTITSSGIDIIGSGTAELEVDGNITASGKILSKDEIILDDNGGDTLVRAYASGDDGIIDVYQNNNVLTRIAGNGTSFFKDNEGVLIGPGSTIAAQSIGGAVTSLTVEGHISSSGELYVDHRVFDTGSTTLGAVGGGMGDIVKFGGTTTVAGAIYQLKSAGTWALTDADAAADATGSIAVALGTNSTTNGMLLRGMAKLNHDPGGGIGAPLYLSVNAGSSSNAAPTGNNDIARIIGYNIDTAGKIYFNPDNTYVEVSA